MEESCLSNIPPTEEEMFYDFMNLANQQFNFKFERLQKNIEKGMYAGIMFMSDYGDIISIVCYCTGQVELAMVIDGISIACDVTLAICDYYDIERTKSGFIEKKVEE